MTGHFVRSRKEEGTVQTLFDLSGRTALITGSSQGIGRSLAEALAGAGAHVVLNGRTPETLATAAAELADKGFSVSTAVFDVTDAKAVSESVASIESERPIDILVNNAGILRDKSFAKMSLDDFRLVVDVHLMGAVNCTKAVWEIMREQQYGRIVMTTSSSGLYGNFGQANYAAAKMALVGLMQTLAIEGARYGIHVNCLAPTAATGMTEGVLSPEALAQLDPALVSPGLLALVGENAPSRAVLCAGGGHFARANVTLTDGAFIGEGDDAGKRVVSAWRQIGDRDGEIVPEYGFTQAERELASAGYDVTALAASR